MKNLQKTHQTFYFPARNLIVVGQYYEPPSVLFVQHKFYVKKKISASPVVTRLDRHALN